MKSLLYFQSGGPTPVINTSLYGVIKEAKLHSEIKGIYGSLYGIEGVLNDNLIDLRQEDDQQIELLKQTPGAILGTTRYKLSDDLGHPDYYKILITLKKHDIGYLLVNGGNDSMDTCHKLSQFMKRAEYECAVIGIPKTIDNDLNYTDHCLGFPSAAKYVVQSLQDIAIDNMCYNKGKIAIVEVMGRNAGWLTAAAALLQGDLKPDRIYLPQ
jgi:6-phosphofructokinase 1